MLAMIAANRSAVLSLEPSFWSTHTCLHLSASSPIPPISEARSASSASAWSALVAGLE
jgi:hypothetical protein